VSAILWLGRPTEFEILYVRMALQEAGETFFHAWELYQEHRRRFLGLLYQARWVKVGLSVVDAEHEGSFAIPTKDITDDRRSGAMVALDVELRLAQNPDIDACCVLPRRFLGMIAMPAQQSIDVEFILCIESLRRGLDMLAVFPAMIRVTAAQDGMVQL
jgi:hypothetical protein